jgi:hypothetical protein
VNKLKSIWLSIRKISKDESRHGGADDENLSEPLIMPFSTE